MSDQGDVEFSDAVAKHPDQEHSEDGGETASESVDAGGEDRDSEFEDALDDDDVEGDADGDDTNKRQREDDKDGVEVNVKVKMSEHQEETKEVAPAKAPAEEEEEEERVCRYCFDGTDSGELMSPCSCKGGQKWVHMSCLRRWQRMVLVSQPTHPSFWTRDKRHYFCNVCNGKYTCAPPTREELMASFTGPELAAMLAPGFVIGSSDTFSRHLEEQLRTLPDIYRRAASYDHWIRGIYIITSVEPDDGRLSLDLTSESQLRNVRSQLDDSLALTLRGNEMHLLAAGSLEGVPQEGLAEALEALEVPCKIVLGDKDDVEGQSPGTANDHISAVNLTRPFDPRTEAGYSVAGVERAVARVSKKYPQAALVEVQHFLGGPCEDDAIVSCIVLGGGGRGWTVHRTLDQALLTAHSRAARRCEEQGDIGGGQTVVLAGLKAAPELNGEVGLTLRFDPASARWLVRLRNGEGKKVKPVNLEGGEGRHGRVFCCWGDARWSRAQLLGEIARGSWGLCRASVADLTAAPHHRRPGLDGRLAFAPVTDMTDDYVRQAHEEMNVLRAEAGLAAGEEAEDAEPDELDLSLVGSPP